MGAAYLGYLEECGRRGLHGDSRSVRSCVSRHERHRRGAEAVIKRRGASRASTRSRIHDRIEERIAELLVSDGVVARCAGRMEFGARALGNRSILANPTDHRVVPLINRMIKNRDFWMPFAPTVLAERASDYLVNPKGLDSPYMMLAMATRPESRDGA